MVVLGVLGQIGWPTTKTDKVKAYVRKNNRVE